MNRGGGWRVEGVEEWMHGRVETGGREAGRAVVGGKRHSREQRVQGQHAWAAGAGGRLRVDMPLASHQPAVCKKAAKPAKQPSQPSLSISPPPRPSPVHGPAPSHHTTPCLTSDLPTRRRVPRRQLGAKQGLQGDVQGESIEVCIHLPGHPIPPTGGQQA